MTDTNEGRAAILAHAAGAASLLHAIDAMASVAEPEDQAWEVFARGGVVFTLWSNKHGAWWRPNDLGYTKHLREAGRYHEVHAAARCLRAAMAGNLGDATVMVAAPDNWRDGRP